MKTFFRFALLPVMTALLLPAIPGQAGSLKDLGRSITYPVRKGVHNAGKSVRAGAGHASKGLNHSAQALQYPVRKTGENTSKTAHKAVGK